MDKTDILNLVWMPLVTDSHCLWQGKGHVTPETESSSECTVQMSISNKECAHPSPLDKRKLHFQHFQCHTNAPLALVQGAENSTWCFSSPSVPRSQWKGSERGKLGMTSTGSSGVWMNISNIWVRAVEDLRVLCEGSNHKTSQEHLVLYRWCVLDGNTRGASGTCRGRAGTRSMSSFTGTVGRLFGRSRKG